MDIIDKIHSATNGGMDIFMYLFPDLADFRNSAKKFRSPLRSDDKVPSAHFWCKNGVYLLKDFALNKAMTAVDAYMEKRGLDFGHAVGEICRMFAIRSDGTPPGDVHATYECRKYDGPAGRGMRYQVRNPTREEIQLLCPYATEKTLQQLGIETIETYSTVRSGKEHFFSSRPGYPIYVRTARMIDDNGNVVKTCHKVYQPCFRSKETCRNYKFMYVERDMAPDTIVNGLYEINEARKRGEKDIVAALCSGERDAVCCMANGVYPVWFNSEGHRITAEEMRRIRSMVSVLYYVPDIDQPGKAFGMENMRRFPTLKVVWLPETLKNSIGDQQKPCKDLRDYVGKHPTKSAFTKLLNTAHCYKFVHPQADGKGLTVSAGDMCFMLMMNGFYKLYDSGQGEYYYVQIEEGNMVSRKTEEQIRTFVIDAIEGYTHAERDKVMGSMVLSRNIKDIAERRLNFCSSTDHSQLFHTRDKAFVVSADGIEEIERNADNYVWKDKVIAHQVTLLPQMFEFQQAADPMKPGEQYFPVTFTTDDCKAALYVQRLSRLNWEKVDAGEPLTEREAYENQKNLQAMMYAIGHMLCKHNSRGNNFAPYFFEFNRYDGVERNGGTGKTTLVLQLLPLMGRSVAKIDVKKERDIDDQFALQEVSETTDIAFFDECYEGFPLSKIYGYVSDGLSYEQKHKKRVTFAYDKMPRICCASNFDPKDFDASSTRRIVSIPVSHYYHYESPMASFKDTRTIASDFGMRLWDENYPEADYNRDINFLMQCVYYYHCVNKVSDKPLEAPLDKVLERYNEGLTENDMGMWAKVYFSDGTGHVNCEVSRDSALSDYNQWLRQHDRKPVKSTTFTKQLKAWVALRPGMEYNPKDKCNSTDRIRRNGDVFFYVQKVDGEGDLPF